MGIERQGTPDHKFQYNGKEKQQELGLEWMDYGARMYDAQIGRWHEVDVEAEIYEDFTPYSYVGNNPINALDPDGRNIYLLTNDGRTVLALKTDEEHKFFSEEGEQLDALGKDAMVVAGSIAESSESEALYESLGNSTSGKAIKKNVGIYNAQLMKNSFLDLSVDMVTSIGAFRQLASMGWKLFAREASEQAITKSPRLLGTARMNLLNTVKDPELRSLVKQLYRENATIGSGSTADYIRKYADFGHIEKGRDRINQLRGLLRSNSLKGADREVAEYLLRDLNSAMNSVNGWNVLKAAKNAK